MTTRGMKEPEMKLIGSIMAEVIGQIKDYKMPTEKEARIETLKQFRAEIAANGVIKGAREKVIALSLRFPIYPGLDA